MNAEPDHTHLPPLPQRVATWRQQLPSSLPPAGPELIVALDVDGTLLGPGGTVSEPVHAAVAQLHRTGTRVVLATGRSVQAVAPIARDFGLTDIDVVCSNGAVIAHLDHSGYHLLDMVTFDPGPAVRLLQREVPGLLFAVEDLDQGFKVNRPFPPGELGGDVQVLDLEELVATPATRVTVRAPDLPGEDFQDMVGQVGLQGVSYAVTLGVKAWLDITPEGISKASGLQNLCQRLGTSAEAVLALGDGGNDVPMLRWAGYGVAMGHAQPHVLTAADARTDSVADDGAAVVLAALVP